ncbi:MAG: hypothetical protein IKE60_26425 [Reyranella sp.]|uniref:hypothetical protein n=1 Tax=Reyranella sp. TaxID=1929291 RepID=UPI0025EFC3DD|nr:hypothetical protein [Reyranella sp.]MBR2818226.1 hypothetical protein [Reyranella sp.]
MSGDRRLARRNAISGIESGGNYSALGPVTKSGDRAYGRYQVMGANIPSWTQAALGRTLTPSEFLSSPEAQDAVFDHRFGGYADKHGEDNAASLWFSGQLLKGNNAADQLGTTVPEYVRKYLKALGSDTGETYTQIASAPPVQDERSSTPEYVSAPPLQSDSPFAEKPQQETIWSKLLNSGQALAQSAQAQTAQPDMPMPAPAPAMSQPQQTPAQQVSLIDLVFGNRRNRLF